MLLNTMIAQSPVAAVLSDPRQSDNPIVACNAAFEALTGYTRDEIVGHNCRFLAGGGTEAELTQVLREGIEQRRPIMVEILNYKRDGTPFRNAVMVAPIFDARGDLEYFLGSQVELSQETDALQRREVAVARIMALSPRQREIVTLMAKGKLNKQIAFELGVTERTVKMHRTAMLRALKMRTAADVIRLAVEAGF